MQHLTESTHVSLFDCFLFADRPNEPRVIKLPQSVTVKVPMPCKFILELENAENLTVQWFKGSSKVEKSDRVKSVKSGNAFKLDFKVYYFDVLID